MSHQIVIIDQRDQRVPLAVFQDGGDRPLLPGERTRFVIRPGPIVVACLVRHAEFRHPEHWRIHDILVGAVSQLPDRLRLSAVGYGFPAADISGVSFETLQTCMDLTLDVSRVDGDRCDGYLSCLMLSECAFSTGL